MSYIDNSCHHDPRDLVQRSPNTNSNHYLHILKTFMPCSMESVAMLIESSYFNTLERLDFSHTLSTKEFTLVYDLFP